MNKIIIEQLELLIKQKSIEFDFSTGKDRIKNNYSLQATKDALKVIKKIPFKITNSSQLKDMKKIGKKTIKRVDEILKTGSLSEITLTKSKEDYLKIVEQLTDLYGIGHKRAYDLVTQHNITSINDLIYKYESGEIQLPDMVIKGIKYHDKIKENIPRGEIDDIYTFLSHSLTEIDDDLFGTVCGSYRRQHITSNDVDFIIIHPSVQTKEDVTNSNFLVEFIELLKLKGFIVDSLTGDDVNTKYMGIFIWNDVIRRIDIRFIPYESYYYSTLYFTGSKNFNTKMRKVAIANDYTLNEYGLFDNKGNSGDVTCEKDIFDMLGMEYITPDKRE